MSIPASNIVNIIPGVLGAGGNALSLNGVILSDSELLPVGAPIPFTSASAVSDYFGVNSVEAEMATIYFNGYDNSTVKPGTLFFSRYASAAVAGFNRGGAASDLDTLKSLGTVSLTISIDDTPVIGTVSLADATSLSDVASKLEVALGVGTVDYSSSFNAFTVASPTTGSTSAVSYATAGTLATNLALTAATGATLSAGSDAMVPATAMSLITTYTQNWVGFASTFQPDLANKKAFATWTNGTGGRYFYACWDTDATAVGNPLSFAGFGKWLEDNDVDGTVPVYNNYQLAAFVLGTVASIDYATANGRITLAFKSQDGFVATVTDETSANNLKANGYNFYGAYATANQGFNFFYPGQISGDYNFADSYVDAIWLDNALQLAILSLLTSTNSLPYNDLGYDSISMAAQDPINAALNAGVIRTGIPLSAAQRAEVNSAAGIQIDQTLSTRGWYFQVVPASAQVRAARQSPPCKLWYTDGGSIQQINLASIAIQ